jgi:hypothetical protein
MVSTQAAQDHLGLLLLEAAVLVAAAAAIQEDQAVRVQVVVLAEPVLFS